MPSKMAASTNFTAISLEGTPAKLADGPVKLKLFYETDKDEDLAELFLNIDVPKSRVELREKDPEYRAAIVRALGRR
jgi:hypothetical protein